MFLFKTAYHMGSIAENEELFLLYMTPICERVVKERKRWGEKSEMVTKNSLDRTEKKVYNIKVKM